MTAVSYSLISGNKNSDEYYLDVNELADQVLSLAENSLAPIVENFSEYLTAFGLEKPRAKEEYILELLSFGILWRTYAKQALLTGPAPFITMARMGEWRKKHQRIKPLIDFARGILITLFLLPDTRKKNNIR